MSETKLYGIERPDGTISHAHDLLSNDDERLGFVAPYRWKVVEIVAVSADRLRALESLVRAADDIYKWVEAGELPGTMKLANYRIKRAAVGEIGEE